MKRRINITLSENVIKALDSYVKKNKKNRSKTIEEIIEEKLRKYTLSFLK